jgi:hypothetical protein
MLDKFRASALGRYNGSDHLVGPCSGGIKRDVFYSESAAVIERSWGRAGASGWEDGG